MIKLSEDKMMFESVELDNLKDEIRQIMIKLHNDENYLLKAEYYLTHFFEEKILEINRLLNTHQVSPIVRLDHSSKPIFERNQLSFFQDH